MLDEVKTGRALVSKQREELAAADAQLEAEKKNSASLEKSNNLATQIIESKDKAIGYLEQTVSLKSEAVNMLKERNEQLKRDASKNRKRAFWATAAAVILGGVLVMK